LTIRPVDYKIYSVKRSNEEEIVLKKLNIGGKVATSAIALGCMRMAEKDYAVCDKIICAALECGITHFDHADIYGRGVSEEKFGRYLAAHPSAREKMILQSKCAIHDGFYDFSKEHILSSVEGSLSRLKTDYLDFLLLHRPDTLMEPDEVAEAFDKLEREGKVRGFGVSNFNPMQTELLKTAVKQPLVINQLQFSMTEAGIIASGMNVNMKNGESVMRDGGLLEYCRIKGITVQAWSPMQFGFFEGVYVGNREKFPALNAELDALAEKYSVSPSAIVAAWILRHPAGIQAIIGSMNEERIKSFCMGADVTLTRAEWYALYRSAGHSLP